MIRIFYLGCHKLLIDTELKELRNLGYEVYRPTYFSSEYDQSANCEPDSNPTTLPKFVLEKLNNYNFFYQKLNLEIAQLIDSYFDVIIVTISPNWLRNILKATKAPLIYRTYGQPYNLSRELNKIQIPNLIKQRGNFYYSPHSELALEEEHLWLTKNMHIIPYWVEEMVYKKENMWDQKSTTNVIGLFCPNISNSYYNEHYNFLNKNFFGSQYKIFGIQPNRTNDSRVIGTLEREEQLKQMLKLRAIIHTYPEPNTSYLFAVEGAILGIPVLSAKGNLFSKMLANSSGIYDSPSEAQAMIKNMSNNQQLTQSIIIGQSKIPLMYNRNERILEFRNTYVKLINQIVIKSIHTASKKSKERLVILFHFGDSLITFKNNEYLANQGIPRVIKYFAQAMSELDIQVVVTTKEENWQNTWGYFNDGEKKTEIKVIIINPDGTQILESPKLFIFAKKYFYFLSISTIFKLKQFYFKVENLLKKSKKLILDLDPYLQSGDIVLCPHYYLFPEIMDLKQDKKLILYLPDYIPHLYPHKFDKEIRIGERIGQKVSMRSNLIITNSLYTSNYLPETDLNVDPAKIRVFPLPILSNPVRDVDKFNEVKDRKYFFYPTAIRPNKRIDVLLQAFDKLVENHADLYLVLTSNPNTEFNARKIFDKMLHADRVLIFENVTDSQLKVLYLNCEAVIVSTESEGNFPTQLTEALTLGKPTLSAFIEVITQEIGPESLLHFEPGSIESLYMQMKFLLENLSSESHRSVVAYDTFIKDSDVKAKKALKQIIEEMGRY